MPESRTLILHRNDDAKNIRIANHLGYLALEALANRVTDIYRDPQSGRSEVDRRIVPQLEYAVIVSGHLRDVAEHMDTLQLRVGYDRAADVIEALALTMQLESSALSFVFGSWAGYVSRSHSEKYQRSQLLLGRIFATDIARDQPYGRFNHELLGSAGYARVFVSQVAPVSPYNDEDLYRSVGGR